MKQTGVGLQSKMTRGGLQSMRVKGGYMSRVSRGDGSDCVADERNDLQEGFFFNRQGTFFCSQGIEAGEVWVETQSTFKGGKGLMFES